MDLHVCDYLGCLGQHLCFYDGDPLSGQGYSAGTIKFLDNTYTPVGDNFTAVNSLNGPDLHELNTPAGYNGEIILQNVYQPVQADLSSVGGPSDGHALSGCFQEVDIASKNETFQWCSLDHVPLNESSLPFVQGTDTVAHPYDYFHLNAVDKDMNGDYLVSSRHCDTLYKVAGMKSSNPGEIIWRLGGRVSDFKNQGSFNFSRQHFGRFGATIGSATNISLFDNGSDGVTAGATTANASSGMVVSVDTAAKTATLVEQYVHPEGYISTSQGDFQLLSNGNRFMGWGSDAAVSEYAEGGEVLYHARFVQNNYRAFRFPWVGHPSQQPDIMAYAENCTAPVIAYMSWNGATEVDNWAVYGGESANGTFNLGGGSTNTGFETSITLSANGTVRYVYAEAKDVGGNVMNQTVSVPVWVPNGNLAKSCNATMCAPGATKYTYADAGTC